MTKITMTVNGKSVSGEVEGRTLLVDFLRNDLRLTGTHVGCDTSQCGACTVHVDGNAVKSCSILAAEADGADVSTIESQANADGSLSTIQAAFQEHHGLQCGYCTPGMIMNAYGLLLNNPEPSREEIVIAMDENLCRCGAHGRIIQAIQNAGKRMTKTVMP